MARRQARAPDFQALKKMPDQSSPRAIIKGLLRGESPPRTLLMPIMFSLGARLESLPLREFQSNPTKITNALRQIRNVLKVDGLTCYFDPCLEAEALGCTREWRIDGSCGITGPSFSNTADLRDKMKTPDSLAAQGFVPVACEVIRRLKLMVKDEPALMVRVSGPLSLAAQLSSICGGPGQRSFPPHDLVEFAAEITAAVAKSLAEAGADVVLIIEDLIPELSPETGGWYRSLLAPIDNMLRFYEALPVLVPGEISETSLALLFEGAGTLQICPMPTSEMPGYGLPAQSRQQCLGIALPAEAFWDAGHYLEARSAGVLSAEGVCLVISDKDTPPTTDIKSLSAGLNALRDRFRLQPHGS